MGETGKKRIRLVKNALLMPLQGNMDAFSSGVFVGGQCLPDSLLYRGVAALPQPPARRLEGTYIFGGYLFAHYGHFLLESLSRLYAIRQCPEKQTVLFMSPRSEIFPLYSLMFRALGMRHEIRIVDEPLEVEKLVYSPPGCQLNPVEISDEQLAALGRLKVTEEAPQRKIWLSRSAFPGGGVENEAEIEAELSGCGWQVVHPEHLPLSEQIRLIAGSGLVAGFCGTAFLNTFLAERVCGRFMVIGRAKNVNPVITSLLKRKGIQPEEYYFPLEYCSGQGATSRYFMADTGPLLELLRNAKV